MAHLKKPDKVPKSGGGRGDLLSAIQQGLPLKKTSERKDAMSQPERRMSLHDVMVDAMGGMRGLMGTISDDGSSASSDGE